MLAVMMCAGRGALVHHGYIRPLLTEPAPVGVQAGAEVVPPSTRHTGPLILAQVAPAALSCHY
jgi:hypothetical protein